MVRKILKLDVKNDFVVKGRALEGVRKICSIDNIKDYINCDDYEEIIIIDYTKSNFGLPPNYDAIKKISTNFNLAITYGGGLKTIQHVKDCLKYGASRFYFNTLIDAKNSQNTISELAGLIGSQALVLGYEFRVINNIAYGYINAGRDESRLTLKNKIDLINKCYFGELLITDIEKDGCLSGFNENILLDVHLNAELVVCGGIRRSEINILDKKIDGVAICTDYINS
jgi:imidazole glycerol-phosphate synthase subunit HisF